MREPHIYVSTTRHKVKEHTRRQLNQKRLARERAKAAEAKRQRGADKYLDRTASKVDAALEGCK